MCGEKGHVVCIPWYRMTVGCVFLGLVLPALLVQEERGAEVEMYGGCSVCLRGTATTRLLSARAPADFVEVPPTSAICLSNYRRSVFLRFFGGISKNRCFLVNAYGAQTYEDQRELEILLSQ